MDRAGAVGRAGLGPSRAAALAPLCPLMIPRLRLPAALAPLCLALGACSSLLGGDELPRQSPALAGMEEPLELQAEPQDESAREQLPAGAFSGASVADAHASLDA